MKKIIAGLTVGAMALTGCGSREDISADDNYVGVCVDDDGERVDDVYCSSSPDYVDDGSTLSGFFWGYLIANALMPNYGGRVTNYVTRVDDTRHNVYRGGVPRSGGYVDFRSYKPLSSKTTAKPNNTVKSESYNSSFNKSKKYSTDMKFNSGGSKSKSNNNTYKAPKSGGGGGFKGGSSGGGFKSGGRR